MIPNPLLFFEIHRDLPREGPGDSQSTGKAFSMLKDLPPKPHILDIGCGPGMQTMDLIKLTKGTIVAVDNHQPYLDVLSEKVTRTGFSGRIQVMNHDMFTLDFKDKSFDVIWAEGAIYIIGFKKGIKSWKPLLKKSGYLVVSEISWLKPDAPEEIKNFWEIHYPAIQDIKGNLEIIRNNGYKIVGYFTLPESAWWNDYYNPLQKRLTLFQEKYKNNEDALQFAQIEQVEINLYRKFSVYYGYVFYIMQKM
jgi:ubiquinone/menaquinone biosynthesis C-methylase UbiE